MWTGISDHINISSTWNHPVWAFCPKDSYGEEMTPKWQRLLKFAIYTTVLCLIAYYFGRKWFYVTLGVASLFPLIVHICGCQRKELTDELGS